MNNFHWRGGRYDLEIEVVKRFRLEGESRWRMLFEGEGRFCSRKRNERLNEFDHLVIKKGEERKHTVCHSWARKQKKIQAEAT